MLSLWKHARFTHPNFCDLCTALATSALSFATETESSTVKSRH